MNRKLMIVSINLMIILTPCQAEVATDGTVGSAQDLVGPNFSIGQNLGTLSGGNLFHSFSHFNLTNGQSATFTGDAIIQNVISRVTGGEVSNIDGTLKSEIGQAAVYFINPAGIVFGQDAKVDVPGAFYASTANELQFADGGRFSAANLQASSLSMAAPAAFGFLGAQMGELKFNGTNLEFKAGTAVRLSAGKIIMDKAKITQNRSNPNGDGIDLQLVTTGNTAQTVGVQTLPDDVLQGELTLKNTTLDVSGNGGGRFSVWAGNVDIADSKVSARNTGGKDASATQGMDVKGGNITLDNTGLTTNALDDGKAGTVMVFAQNKLAVVSGGQVFSGTSATGNAGEVNVKAGTILIDGQKSTIPTVISSEARVNSSGQGGTVTVTAQNNLSVVNGGGISSDTLGKGNAGAVNVQAESIQIDGQGLPTLIGSVARANSGGQAGVVTVTAQNELSVVNGGQIGSVTSSTGDSGGVDVKAGSIRIDGQGLYAFTGIASNAGTGSSGKAGMVSITAQNELAVLSGGEISSSTFGKGDAGNVDVKSGSMLINGQGSQKDTGIFSTTGKDRNGNQFNGKAGSVTVNVQNGLAVVSGGAISSGTLSKGEAGKVNINAGSILVDNGVIVSNALKDSSGNAGAVTVSVQNELAVVNGGEISSDTRGTGDAGSVNVNAGTIRIDRQGSKEDTVIASRAADSNSNGKAGIVTVAAQKNLTIINGGVISSSTFGKGDAGAVDVKAGSIRIDQQGSEFNTGIFSNANTNTSSRANAGAVTVAAQDELAVVNGGEISSNTSTQGDAGTVNVQAGTIRIDGQGANKATGIFSNAKQKLSGKAGSVTVTASKALQINQGQINIRSDVYAANPTAIQQNKITVIAPQIELTDNSKINASSTGNVPASAIQINTNQLTLKGESQITTSANQGNGGPISINANDWLFLNNSQITTSVTGKDNGNGGDITLNGDVLVMDSGFIQANTNATNASGGNINLNVKQLVAGQDNLQRGGSTPLTFIPNSGLNVIQAASPTGVNGNINISAPQLNIVGALVGLNNPELDLSRVGHDPCSDTVRQSTLKRSGKGGVPLFNKGQDGYTLDRLLDTEPNQPENAQPATHRHSSNQDCKPKPAQFLQSALTHTQG